MAAPEDVPAFFKNMGSGSPKPRQKFCGMFCPVEGSSDSKTLDFDSLSTSKSAQPGGRVIEKQGDISRPKVEIRHSTGKEALQNLNDKVSRELISHCHYDNRLFPFNRDLCTYLSIDIYLSI